MIKCNKSVYLASRSIDMIDAVNKGYAEGYNKAIDDFAKEVKEAIDIRLEQVSPISDVGSNMCAFYAIVDEIAEQLKVGGENESK